MKAQKNDHDFLAGMWQKVSALEYEEREKEGARRRNRQYIGRGLVSFLVLTLPLTAYLSAGSRDQTILIAWAAIVLTVSLALEYWRSGDAKRRGTHGRSHSN